MRSCPPCVGTGAPSSSRGSGQAGSRQAGCGQAGSGQAGCGQAGCGQGGVSPPGRFGCVTRSHPKIPVPYGAEQRAWLLSGCPGCGVHLTSRSRCWYPVNLANRAERPAFPRDGGMDPVAVLQRVAGTQASCQRCPRCRSLLRTGRPEAVPQFPHVPSRGGWRRRLPPARLLPTPWQRPAQGRAGFSRGRGPNVAAVVAQGRAMGLPGGTGAGPQPGAVVAQGAGSCWIRPGERSDVCGVGGEAVTPPAGADPGDRDVGRWPRDGWTVEQVLPSASSPASSRDAGGMALLPPPAPGMWPLKAQLWGSGLGCWVLCRVP